MNVAKRAILNTLRRLGYDLIAVPAAHDGNAYAGVRSSALYSPWNVDAEFLKAYALAKPNTLVDMLRLYELWSLVGQSAKFVGDILEVGTWRGGSGAILALRAKAAGLPCRVYLCDTFQGVVKTGANDAVYRGGEHADASRAAVEIFLHDDLQLENVTILEGIFPDQTGSAIENGRFRLCHIDVDVYQSAKDVTAWIWPRLVVGGMIVYDDYAFPNTAGITKMVDEQRDLPDRITVYNLNGHAVVVKIS